MYEWQNSGPPPLDLLTPLEQGVDAGQRHTQVQEQIRANAARESEMKARLGLEEKQQNFQQSMWNSQADMRSAQLDLTKNQAAESANNLTNVVQDHTALTDGMSSLDAAAAKGDFTTVLNTPPPSFMTPQAAQAYEVHRNQLMQTGVGQSAAQHQNAQLAIQKADIDTQTQQLQEIGKIPNADINSFYDTQPDGSKSWNKGRAAAAITDFNVNQTKNAETFKNTLETNRETAVQAARTKGYIEAISAKGTKETNEGKVQMEGLRAALSAAQKNLASARNAGDSKAIASAQAAYDGVNGQLQAALAGQSGAVAAPSAQATQSPTDWLNALGH